MRDSRYSLYQKIMNLVNWYREDETVPDGVIEYRLDEETILDGMEEWLPSEDQELLEALDEQAQGIDQDYAQEVMPKIRSGLKELKTGYPEDGQEKMAGEILNEIMTLSDLYLDRFRDHE